MKNIYTATAKANRKAEITFNKILLLLLLTLVQMGVLRAQDNVNLVIKDVVMGKSEASATTSITLKDGFRAVAGSDFRAYINASAPAPVGVTNPATTTPTWAAPAAGTNTMNYVKTISYLEAQPSVPTGAFKHLAEIQYFDGLGRPVQAVSIGASPSQKDVIQPILYDDYGREAKKVLPYLDGSATGAYRTGDNNSILSAVTGYYSTLKGDNVPYTQITFDNSPLNRVVAQQGPGAEWAGHAIGIRYLTNNTTKDGWKVTTSYGYVANNYPASSLFVTETKGEQNDTTREYKDKQGQVVIKESKLGNEWLRTAYIYDDFGLLRCVVPPKAGGPGDSALCYYYRYDERNRMIEKRIPGSGRMLMVYDDRDRLRFVQNALQAVSNEWSFTKYDALNRPVITGVYTYSSGASALKTAMAAAAMNETYDNSTTCYGYTNVSYPALNKDNVLTVAYYDDYRFIKSGLAPDDFKSHTYDAASYTFGDFTNVIAKGRVTGGMTKVVSDATDAASIAQKELYSATYYDKYGHVLRTITGNHLGGKDVMSNNYETFTYRVLSTKQQHYSPTENNLPIEKFFEYDHAGRLLATRLSVNGAPQVTMNAMKYNELGEMTQKYLHSNGTSGERIYKQKVDYTYNIRGWLTQINDPTLGSDNDLFGMQLFYQKTTDLGGLNGATPQYNGNIAGMKWNIKNDKVRGYGFSYDGLNRLLKASYKDGAGLTENTDRYMEEITSYDKNGNIEGLKRKFEDILVDNLNYDYLNDEASNQLKKITDSGTAHPSFRAYPGTSNDYAYDANGNMKTDGVKNLSIVYNNVLNLPKSISTTDNTNYMYYHYTATGVKLLKHKDNNLTHYVGNIVYEGSKLSYIITEEGRLVATGEGTNRVFAYEYNLKDHLGNNRVTFTGASLGNGIDMAQTSSYYPFGLTMVQNNINNNSSYPKNKYLYNGKELQDEAFLTQNLDWLDYGARFYDPQIGRFHTIDTYSEKYYDLNPYQFVANNPIKYIDVNGDSIWVIFKDANGKVLKNIPYAVQKMFNEEFGISVTYNAETQMMGFGEDVNSELSQSTTATDILKKALIDDNSGNKRPKKNGMIVFGYKLKDYTSGAIVDGGSWTSNISNIDLDDFDQTGKLKAYDYIGVPTRAMNVARVFEEEYLGHNYLNSASDGSAYGLSKVNKQVNSYSRERNLPERLNYGGRGVPIYYGDPNKTSSDLLRKMTKGTLNPTMHLKQKNI